MPRVRRQKMVRRGVGVPCRVCRATGQVSASATERELQGLSVGQRLTRACPECGGTGVSLSPNGVQ